MIKFIIFSGLFFNSLFAQPQEITLTFLHFNDIYKVEAKNGIGGFAQLATAINEERAKAEYSITLVSGDFLAPSDLSNKTKGKHMVELFNAVEVDIVSLGNHEFEFGLPVLKQRMEESHFTWLCFNVQEHNKKSIGKTLPYCIKEIGGIKVGFAGIVTQKAKKALPELYMTPPIAAAHKAVKTLQNEGAEIIVLLTHLDFEQDLQIMKEVPNIHLILGGHDHYPMTHYNKHTLVHKSGSDGSYLGVLHLKIQIEEKRNLRVIPSWTMRSIFQLKHEPAIEAIVDRWKE